MQRKKEYTPDVKEDFAWIPRWKDEPTQHIRFLADEMYAMTHAGQFYTLVCQQELGLKCRLCASNKPAKKSGFALVEKDADGAVRMFKAGCKQFWEPFNREHSDDMKNHWFTINYDKSFRLTPYQWKVESGAHGEAFATEDDLEERLMGLAGDQIYNQSNIKPVQQQNGRNREPELPEDDENRDGSYREIDDPEI
jgi:hypothetical protein